MLPFFVLQPVLMQQTGVISSGVMVMGAGIGSDLQVTLYIIASSLGYNWLFVVVVLLLFPFFLCIYFVQLKLCLFSKFLQFLFSTLELASWMISLGQCFIVGTFMEHVLHRLAVENEHEYFIQLKLKLL